MNQTDQTHLLQAIHSLRDARLSINRMTADGRAELRNTDLANEIMQIEDAIGDKWLSARRLRAIPSEARSEASRANGGKGSPESHRRGGRPKIK